MKTFELDAMTRCWFVGDFEPTALSTTACEAAVKRYKKGDREDAHFHAIATELTLVVDGYARFSAEEIGPGGIVVVEPGEVLSFEAVTDDDGGGQGAVRPNGQAPRRTNRARHLKRLFATMPLPFIQHCRRLNVATVNALPELPPDAEALSRDGTAVISCRSGATIPGQVFKKRKACVRWALLRVARSTSSQGLRDHREPTASSLPGS